MNIAANGINIKLNSASLTLKASMKIISQMKIKQTVNMLQNVFSINSRIFPVSCTIRFISSPGRLSLIKLSDKI